MVFIFTLLRSVIPFLYLTYQIHTRSQRIITRLPLRRANLIAVAVDELSGLKLSYEFRTVSSYALIVHFISYNIAFGMKDEACAVPSGKTGVKFFGLFSCQFQLAHRHGRGTHGTARKLEVIR